MKVAQTEAENINQTGRLARKEQELYASLSNLARRYSIRVDQMMPAKVLAANAKSGPQTGQPAAENPDSGPNAAVGYTIDATATYGDIAEFVRSIRSELGYSVVKSVRLSPIPDNHSKLVHAFIETEHYSFDASPIQMTPPPGAPGATP